MAHRQHHPEHFEGWPGPRMFPFGRGWRRGFGRGPEDDIFFHRPAPPPPPPPGGPDPEGEETGWGGPWGGPFPFGPGRHGRGHWLFRGRRWRGEPGANPFIGLVLSKSGGLLPVFVLQLLAEQPRHGNELMREIERHTGGAWASNPGAMYPLLSALEGQGFIQGAWAGDDPSKRSRRVYQITEAGRAELAGLKEALKPKLLQALDILSSIYENLFHDAPQDAPPADAPRDAKVADADAAPETI